MRYEAQSDGTLKNGKIFYDFNFTEDDEALDGIKIDREGNLFVSAPGGVWILSPDGKSLGKDRNSGASSKHDLVMKMERPYILRRTAACINKSEYRRKI